MNRRVQGVCTRSLLKSATPEGRTQREQEFRDLPGPLQRRAAQAVHHFTLRHPAFVGRYVGIDYQILRQLPVVGMGYDAIVIRDGSADVVKLHHQTLTMSAAQKRTEAQRRQSRFESLASYMGKFVLPQTTEVGTHSLFADTVVQTRQPYRQVHFPEIFDLRAWQVNPTALQHLLASYPRAAAQLHDFWRAGTEFYEATGLLPDTAGQGNIGVDASSHDLLLLDAVPIEPDSREYGRIRYQLGQLGTAVGIALAN